jgi:hypothetical protein
MNEIDYEAALRSAKTTKELYSAIVNAPFTDKASTTSLGLGIVVLLLVNKKTKTLDRIALSDTDLAAGAVRMSAKPFHEIKIPLSVKENILIQAIETGEPQQTDDWQYLFVPVLTPQEAKFNQFGAGIERSVVYPIITNRTKKARGAMIFSYFQLNNEITDEHTAFMQAVAGIAEQYLAKLKV